MRKINLTVLLIIMLLMAACEEEESLVLPQKLEVYSSSNAAGEDPVSQGPPKP